MKKTLITLAIGLGLASNAAFAAETGSIRFFGTITAGPCNIQVVDPISKQPLDRVDMGNPAASKFVAIGDEASTRPFGLMVNPGTGCIIDPNVPVRVTFSALHGGAGAGGALYGLESGTGSAKNVALTIKDDTATAIPNGVPSKEYSLDATDPTIMLFSAAYKSTAAGVTAGAANTDIGFSVDIP